MMTKMTPKIASLALAAALALGATQSLAAQQQPGKPPKKATAGQTIEIRGQAPTPQVVTVRPREVPTYTPTGLSATLVASGAWPNVSSAYSIAPSDQVAGRLPLDTTQAGLARGGAVMGGVYAAGAAAGAQALSSGNAPVGANAASAAEIEAMRRELAMRRARLDSLEAALHGNEAMANSLGVRPAGPRGSHMSAADSAARAAEVEAIRRELHYRKIRLDSLQREVNTIGRPHNYLPADSTDKATTVNGGTPPR